MTDLVCLYELRSQGAVCEVLSAMLQASAGETGTDGMPAAAQPSCDAEPAERHSPKKDKEARQRRKEEKAARKHRRAERKQAKVQKAVGAVQQIIDDVEEADKEQVQHRPLVRHWSPICKLKHAYATAICVSCYQS